ncbi:MAG: 3-isopropylmalate/(R)-2-methylmalate dehydratase small subunit, partial [Aliidongia sp.]|nr:3-isopropylmalate/(R)-2-methylmalate dehydratase small subunit [Aliidongia sp.]
GVLPIRLDAATVAALMADATNGANAVFTIDLEKQTVSRPDGQVVAFEIDPFRKHCMLKGLDDIGLTLEKAPAIERFEDRQRLGQPWLSSNQGMGWTAPDHRG